MNRLIFTGILFFLTANILAQKILLVENVSSLKNFKYYQGADISISCPGSDGRIDDVIVDLTDSTVVFEIMGEVSLKDISCIFRENKIVQILRGFTLIAGTAYFGLDTFNRLINHDNPVILTETLLISGGLVAFSFALIPFRYRKLHTGGKWQLRTIDLNSF